MHYILNADNYISAISFGCDIECADGYCQEYTGGIPTGYTSLDAWYAAEGENLYRWKIVNGQLTKDDEAAPPAPDKLPYAPEGYGLGEAAGQLVIDCNAAVLSGWYQLAEYAINAPDTSGHLMRVSACASSIYQEVFTDGGTVTRWRKNGFWSVWEWVNPPMQSGVEYRTTARWNGKVVYTKLVDLGALGAAMTYKQVPHGITCTKFVGADGYAITNDQYLRLLSTNDNADGNGDNYLYIMPSEVFIQVGITSLYGYNAYVTLRYIKD